jgi:hypothetical protein
MSISKTAAIAILAAATGLGATMSAANASKHSKTRNIAVGVVAGAVLVGAMQKESCKKWKYRYERTGNPVFLDRYYACKY